MNRRFDRKALVTIFAFSVCAILAVWFVISLLSGGTVKPKPTPEQRASDRALLYEASAFYALFNNEDILVSAEQDIYTFAVNTAGEAAKKTGAVGFTFTKGPVEAGEAKEFRGNYYGVSGEIKILVQQFDQDIVRLSMTNLKTGVSIDDSLRLGGARSRLVVDLPIETTSYSMRYFYGTDEVVVTFYDPFSVASVDEVVAILKKYFENSYSETVAKFTINGVGDRTLGEIYEYAKNPPEVFIRNDPIEE